MKFFETSSKSSYNVEECFITMTKDILNIINNTQNYSKISTPKDNQTPNINLKRVGYNINKNKYIFLNSDAVNN